MATSLHSTITYAKNARFLLQLPLALLIGAAVAFQRSMKDISTLLQGVVSRMDMLSGKFDELELRFDKVGIYTLLEDVPSYMCTLQRRLDEREDLSSLGHLSAVS
jgi:hypothetical protein